MTAVEGDLRRIAEGRALAASAAWLVAAAAKAERGATALEGTDWSSGEAVAVRIALDPSKPARQQVEAMFRDAKRRTGGEPVAIARRDEAKRAVEGLHALVARITSAEDEATIDAALSDARIVSARDMPRIASGVARGKRDEPLPPHKTFKSGAGEPIFVGRGASHNDELTFQVARPHHLWLHARGVPGAHVIVPIARNRSVPADLLIDAAHLAAHFSDARGEPVVEITTAPRKWVRKPRGAAPGAVVIEREKVVTLRVEPERLRALLASEVLLGA